MCVMMFSGAGKVIENRASPYGCKSVYVGESWKKRNVINGCIGVRVVMYVCVCVSWVMKNKTLDQIAFHATWIVVYDIFNSSNHHLLHEKIYTKKRFLG